MDLMPTCPITSCSIGDVLKGQDGKKYIVCKKANTMYWEPYEEMPCGSSSNPIPSPKPTPTPNKKVKKIKEKYYWKNNDKKPEYDGDDWYEMAQTLRPKVSPCKFPAGYVWTTKFSNICFIAETAYEGYSTTPIRFWNLVGVCPPCLDAKDYPYKNVSGSYCVAYDENGNKFWTSEWDHYDNDNDYPILHPSHFLYGHIYTTRTGLQFKRIVHTDFHWDANWEKITDNN